MVVCLKNSKNFKKKVMLFLEKLCLLKKYFWIFWMNSGFVYRRILLDIIVYVKIIYIIFFKKEEV